MPSSMDPERLLGLSGELEALGAVARGGAEQALDHFPEIGDRAAQSALDGFLEQLADTLRAVDAEAAELAGRLRIAATSAAPSAATCAAATSAGPAPEGGDRPRGPTGEATRPTRKGMFR